jgi:hypothetical protein
MKRQLRRFCALLVTVAVAAGLLAGAVGASPSPYQVYLPAISTGPAATPPALGCPSTGRSYGALPIVGSPLSGPAAQDPDINLAIRDWAPAPNTPPLSLVTYPGRGTDPSAPQLASLFAPPRLPGFSAAYDVYNWDWSTNSPGTLDDSPWPVTLLGMATRPGELIAAPTSGSGIGQGYVGLVLYATNQQITMAFTGRDSIVDGYALHVENVCVDPGLQALYSSLNAAGRGSLPALPAGQPFGRATGAEIQVAIRDAGTFMDPRSQTDWWHGD